MGSRQLLSDLEFEFGQADERERMQAELDSGRAEADPEVAPLWCGAGVGLIHSIPPAETLVKGIVADAAATVAKLHSLVKS